MDCILSFVCNLLIFKAVSFFGLYVICITINLSFKFVRNLLSFNISEVVKSVKS